MPAELDELSRRILQLEVEREALRKEEDPASKERLGNLEGELANLKERADALKAQWQREKETIERVSALKEQIDQVKVQIEQAQRAYDLNRASELQYGRLPQLERQLHAAEAQTAQAGGGPRLFKQELDADEHLGDQIVFRVAQCLGGNLDLLVARRVHEVEVVRVVVHVLHLPLVERRALDVFFRAELLVHQRLRADVAHAHLDVRALVPRRQVVELEQPIELVPELDEISLPESGCLYVCRHASRPV